MDRRAIRNKKNKPRNVRPYDRPNQGILGKVASKVKDLLTPSWIFNVSQWISTPQDQPGSANTPDEESADEDEAPPQTTTTTIPTTRGSKRPRLRLHEPSILSEGTQTWLDTPSSSNLFNQSPHLPSTVTQSTLVENKECPIMNGDDHSENSEGSASTSGCSSLVSSHKERSNCLGPSNLRLSESALANLRGTLKNTVDLKNRRDIASQKEGFSSPNTSASRLSLWSGGMSPASKFHRRSPSVANTSQPGFNVSAFVAPSKVNQQTERKVASPFYQGKTSFGGASSTRKIPVSTAPYQTERPPRNQIKVRSNQSEDSLEGMSSAAKRILLTLEKMSSPVTDAKKIPNTNKSPVDLSLYMMPPKHRSNVVSTPAGTPKGPPIANISTISKLTTLKSCGMRKFQNSAMESLLVPSEEKKVPADIFQSDLLLSTLTKGGGGGKMKSKLTQQHQPSIGSSSLEQLESVPLPNVPLPISTLPTFSFGPKSDKSAEFINKMGNDFVFSSPIEVFPKVPLHNNISVPHLDSNLQRSNVSQEKQTFTFSSPIEHELPSPILGGVFTTNTSGTWECSSCWVRNSTNESKCMACESPKPSLNSTEPKLPVGSMPATKPFSEFSSNLSNTPSTWKCNSCWIQNPSKEVKCMACETPKPPAPSGFSIPTSKTSSVSISNSASASTWDCSECWIKNPAKELKCLACETPKPGSKVDQTSNSIAKSSSPAFGISSSGTSGFFSSPLTTSSGGFKLPDIPCEASEQTATFGGFKLPAAKPSDSEAHQTSSCKNSDLSTLESIAKSVFGSKSTASSTLNGPSKVSFASKTSNSAENNVSEKEKTISTFSFKTNVTSQSTPVTSSFGEKLASSWLSASNPPGSWECDICLVRNSSGKQKCVACETLRPSKTNMLGLSSAFKITSAVGNTSVTSSEGGTENKWTLPVPVKTDTPGIVSLSPDSKKDESVSSGQSKDAAIDGSNFKMLSSATSAFGGFGTPSSNSDCKVSAQVKDFSANVEKKPDTSLGVNVSTPSLSSPFSIPASTPMFKAGDKAETAKTSESSAIKNVFASSVASSSTTTTTPTFNFSSTPVPQTGLTPTSSQPNISLAPTQTQSFGSMAKSQDIKTVSSIADESVSSGQPKDAAIGGFNFKIPSSATSAFGGFGTPSSNTDSKVSTQVKDFSTNVEKKPDTSLGVNASTPSLSSPFSIPASTPMFKAGDKAEIAKTSESSAIKNVFASSVVSSSTTTTAPTFNFSSTPVPLTGLMPTSSQPNISLALTQTQSFGSMAKSQDVKTVASVAPFSAASTASTFTFGTPAVTTTQSNPSSGFSFFTSSAANATPSTTPSLFVFGNSNASQTSTTGGFTFKGLNEDKPTPTPTNALNFNAPATTSSTSSVFKFNASAPSSTGGFVFGAVKSEPGTASAPTTTFAFGSGSAQSTNSTFSGFQTNPSSTPAFQFGSSQPTPNTAPAPTFGSATNTFTFGKTESANQLPTTQASSGFGVNAMQPMFGGATAPSFGKTEKPVFNFGMPQSSSTPVFQFGEKKQATAPQFFGTPAQEAPAPAPSFPTPQFNFSTPTTFNFGAASTQAGPFQFAASADSQPSSAPRKIRKAVRRVPRKD